MKEVARWLSEIRKGRKQFYTGPGWAPSAPGGLSYMLVTSGDVTSDGMVDFEGCGIWLKLV